MAALPCAGRMAKVEAAPARDEMETVAGLVQHQEGYGADWSPETQGPSSLPGGRGRHIAGRRPGVATGSFSGFRAMRHLALRKRKGGLFPDSIEPEHGTRRGAEGPACTVCADRHPCRVHPSTVRHTAGAGDAGAGGRNGGYPD